MAQFYSTDGGDFFQVIRETAKTVTVRPVRSERVSIDAVRTAFDYDVTHRAVEDGFTTVFYFSTQQNAGGKRCKKNATGNGGIILNDYYDVCAWPCGQLDTFSRDLG